MACVLTGESSTGRAAVRSTRARLADSSALKPVMRTESRMGSEIVAPALTWSSRTTAMVLWTLALVIL